MIRASVLALIACVACARVVAAPLARSRVVLADRDPELYGAVAHALAPWHLTVVVEDPPPIDDAAAAQRADQDTARFVVWRAGDQLVVYDRELGHTERRTSRAGPLDPPTAATAALTIKTMMRLPPPPPAAPPVVDAAPPVVDAPALPVVDAPASGDPEPARLRAEVSVIARVAHGDTTEASPRVALALAARPWRGAPWWLGVAGDLGTAVAVERAGFTGNWSEQALHAVIGRVVAIHAWEIEPALALGLRRSHLSGRDRNTPRDETATLGDAAIAAWARWRTADWSFGARLSVGVTLGAPTYTKTGAAAEIFQVPDWALELGAVVAKDL